MGALDNYLGVSATALKVRAQRMDLIASNIANAATPNYKARDIDFATALKGAQAGAMQRSHADHLGPLAGGQAQAGYRVPNQTSLDGNTVELSAEQVAFSDNAVRYEATLSVLNGRIGTLMSAIKGE